MAADRMVDRAGRLGLLPGRILRADEVREASGHQPRCPPGHHDWRAEDARASRQSVRAADLVLSVSHFNTSRLIEAFPDLSKDRVAYVPNAADDLFFEPMPDRDRASARDDLGLPPQIPYLLSVANFQPRKNLVRLIARPAGCRKWRKGELAIVLIGTGSEAEAPAIREAIAACPARPSSSCPDTARADRSRGLRRGDRPGLPLHLRELRHPRRRGDGLRLPRRAGRFHGPARDRRRRRMVFPSGG